MNGFTHSSSHTIPAFLDFFPFFSAATLASLSHKDTQTNTHQHTHTAFSHLQLLASFFYFLLLVGLTCGGGFSQVGSGRTDLTQLDHCCSARSFPTGNILTLTGAHWPGGAAAHIVHNDLLKMKHQGQKGWKNFPSPFLPSCWYF